MSRTTSSALRRVSMFACILLSAAMAHAQYRTSIQGAVTDTSGAVISGANLTLMLAQEALQQALAQRYADIMAVLVKNKAHVTRVTFWGLTDGQSWKNDFPIKGRTNYPLLFDRQAQPKPAFDAVIAAAKTSGTH